MPMEEFERSDGKIAYEGALIGKKVCCIQYSRVINDDSSLWVVVF